MEPPILEAVFRAFDEAHIRWCLLRMPSDLHAPTGDVDLLIAGADAAWARDILETRDFVLLAAYHNVSDWHFVTYDLRTDHWIRLHIVTDLSFGRFHALETRAAEDCLARRERQGALAVLAPADAFWALLLHCLLDKGTITPDRQVQLQSMVDGARADGPLARLVQEACPARWDAARLMDCVRRGAWTQLQHVSSLWAADWRSRHPIRVYRRTLLEVGARVGARLLVPLRRRGLSVALLGPDGSGKSTLASGLQASFVLPARSIHMALGDHQIPRLARIRIPKLGAPGRLVVTLGRYLKGQYCQSRGWLTIYDRYTYDVLLPSEQRQTRTKQALRWLLAHAFPPPDLVLLLDAPGHVVYARKLEYDPEHMEAHRQHLLELGKRLPRLQVLDATQPKDAVRREATRRIWQSYVARWTHARERRGLMTAGTTTITRDAGNPS